MKYLTLKWLKDNEACEEGIDFFIEQWGKKGRPDLEEVFVVCIENGKKTDAQWLSGEGAYDNYSHDLFHIWHDKSLGKHYFVVIRESDYGISYDYAWFNEEKDSFYFLSWLPLWAQKEARKYVKKNCK